MSISIDDSRTQVQKISIEKYGENYALRYSGSGIGSANAVMGVKPGTLKKIDTDHVSVVCTNGVTQKCVITSDSVSTNTMLKGFTESSSKSGSTEFTGKGYFGLSRWNPIHWILWLICLPFRIVWWLLKMALKIFGIWAIINFFLPDKD